MIILFEPHHWCIFTVWAVNAIEHIVDMASVAAQQTRHLSLLKQKIEMPWFTIPIFHLTYLQPGSMQRSISAPW